MASSIKGTSGESLEEAVKNAETALVIAGNVGLQAEVFGTALIYLKENPQASIEDALNAGLGDWDC